MLYKNAEVTLLRCDLREGNGKKTGKPYSFYQVSVVDEDAKVFQLNLSDAVVKELGEAGLKKLLETRNEAVTLDIKFSPKGFDISGSVQAIA